MEADDFKRLLEAKDVEIPIELTISTSMKMIDQDNFKVNLSLKIMDNDI